MLQVVQVVGAFSQQGIAQLLQNRALLLDRITPGVGRIAALGDGAVAGLQQLAVFEQGQVSVENGFFVEVTLGPGLDQGQADLGAHLLQRRMQRLHLLLGEVIAEVGWQLHGA